MATSKKRGRVSKCSGGKRKKHDSRHDSDSYGTKMSGTILGGDIWNLSEREEKDRIREFWFGLGDQERRRLVQLEKEAVLSKIKEQQRHMCSCSVCGKRRTVIEEELEMLYNAYYEELEHYEQQDPGDESVTETSATGSDDATDDGSFSFARSLTVKGGILTVADELLKNEGKKFLDMMEKLADRQTRGRDRAREDELAQYEEELSAMDSGSSDPKRLEEGRRMFQIFAAKMFEQRVLQAYRERVSFERQEQLIREEKQAASRAKIESLRRKKEQQEKGDKKKKRAQAQQEEERKTKEQRRKEQQERLREKEVVGRSTPSVVERDAASCGTECVAPAPTPTPTRPPAAANGTGSAAARSTEKPARLNKDGKSAARCSEDVNTKSKKKATEKRKARDDSGVKEAAKVVPAPAKPSLVFSLEDTFRSGAMQKVAPTAGKKKKKKKKKKSPAPDKTPLDHTDDEVPVVEVTAEAEVHMEPGDGSAPAECPDDIASVVEATSDSQAGELPTSSSSSRAATPEPAALVNDADVLSEVDAVADESSIDELRQSDATFDPPSSAHTLPLPHPIASAESSPLSSPCPSPHSSSPATPPQANSIQASTNGSPTGYGEASPSPPSHGSTAVPLPPSVARSAGNSTKHAIPALPPNAHQQGHSQVQPQQQQQYDGREGMVRSMAGPYVPVQQYGGRYATGYRPPTSVPDQQQVHRAHAAMGQQGMTPAQLSQRQAMHARTLAQQQQHSAMGLVGMDPRQGPVVHGQRGAAMSPNAAGGMASAGSIYQRANDGMVYGVARGQGLWTLGEQGDAVMRQHQMMQSIPPQMRQQYVPQAAAMGRRLHHSDGVAPSIPQRAGADHAAHRMRSSQPAPMHSRTAVQGYSARSAAGWSNSANTSAHMSMQAGVRRRQQIASMQQQQQQQQQQRMGATSGYAHVDARQAKVGQMGDANHGAAGRAVSGDHGRMKSAPSQVQGNPWSVTGAGNGAANGAARSGPSAKRTTTPPEGVGSSEHSDAPRFEGSPAVDSWAAFGHTAWQVQSAAEESGGPRPMSRSDSMTKLWKGDASAQEDQSAISPPHSPTSTNVRRSTGGISSTPSSALWGDTFANGVGATEGGSGASASLFLGASAWGSSAGNGVFDLGEGGSE